MKLQYFLISIMVQDVIFFRPAIMHRQLKGNALKLVNVLSFRLRSRPNFTVYSIDFALEFPLLSTPLSE